MRWPIIIVWVAAGVTLLAIIAKIVAMTCCFLLFGLHPDAYLRFADTLLLFAISIACIMKFKRSQ